jgi:hypothetical protein
MDNPYDKQTSSSLEILLKCVILGFDLQGTQIRAIGGCEWAYTLSKLPNRWLMRHTRGARNWTHWILRGVVWHEHMVQDGSETRTLGISMLRFLEYFWWRSDTGWRFLGWWVGNREGLSFIIKWWMHCKVVFVDEKSLWQHEKRWLECQAWYGNRRFQLVGILPL